MICFRHSVGLPVYRKSLPMSSRTQLLYAFSSYARHRSLRLKPLADRYKQSLTVLPLQPDGFLSRDPVRLQLAFGNVAVNSSS